MWKGPRGEPDKPGASGLPRGLDRALPAPLPAPPGVATCQGRWPLCLHMGVAKAPVGNLPLLYPLCPWMVPIIPLSGITPSSFASRHAAGWFPIRQNKKCSRNRISHSLN